jgi:phosphoglycolate phosphatase
MIVLFDLDGTLTESGEGIVKSVQYALEKLGKPEPDAARLQYFIGPPLYESFMKQLSCTKEEAEEVIRIYRERYSTIGIFENRPYPGIPEMLEALQRAGIPLAVASSKPERFVNIILEHFGLARYFSAVVGATMGEARTAKKDVIAEVLVRLNRLAEEQGKPPVWSADLLMVGDKSHDVEGARAAGAECVAVAYGYGTPEELTGAHPKAIVQTVEELKGYLLKAAGR